ncbi:MAG: response regulator [Polyangiaceae bacterium]|nr:response regulator [Polyangiaceae bacterium]
MLTRELEEALREFAIDTPPRPRCVLLVDDEYDNLEVLSALLEDDYEVLTATDADSALQVFAAGRNVDLVVADQRMPGTTGVELLSRIAVERPDTVRMVLTAYDDVEPMMEAINRGAVFRFLTKPCPPAELRLAIREGLDAKASANLLRHLIGSLVSRQDALDRVVRNLRRTQDQLLATERLTTMGRAASGVVHNVRNLSMIVSFLVTEIQGSTVSPETIGAGRRALRGLESLVTLLESVREFARTNEAKLELTPTEVEPFFRQTVAVALLEQGTERCPIDLDIAADVRRLSIDRGRVRHAVTAVLSNALRASPPGARIAVRVRVREFCREDRAGLRRWVCIEVEDHGSGMDAATLERAGEPLFSRFDPPGLGLGLSAARLTATIHGGELVLDSRPGEGTRAILVVPEGACSSAPPRVVTPSAVETGSTAGDPILGFVGAQRAPLRVVVTDGAWQILEPAIADSPVLAASVERFAAGRSSAAGPAILVVTGQDMSGLEADRLRELLRAATPGRPVVIGGGDDRRVLLEAINDWRAHSLLPHGAPLAAVTDAVRRAHEKLKLDLAVDLCAKELLSGCRRLALTVTELEATQERLLHAERLATVGRIVGALIARMGEQSRQLEAFRRALADEGLAGGPSPSSRRLDLLGSLDEVHDGFNSLLADMLALAEARSPNARVTAEDLDSLVARTVRLFRYDPLGRERDVRIHSESRATVRVDGSRVRHALLNLLRNAAQATTAAALIEVRTRRLNGVAVIEVEDSGEGMSAETLGRIFTPFFTTKGASGMGLGLRLSRAAIEGHGGTLECTSAVGSGTTFRICLPAIE